MSCINCKTEISKRASDPICVTCRFDPNVTISLTEARTKYKLTDEELKNPNLFKMNFVCHKNMATKFLRTEINELARNLTNNLDNSDKRKKAFNKQDEIITELQNKRKVKLDRIENITNICTDLLVKYSVEVTPEITDYMIKLINEDKSGLNEFQTALKIIDEVNNLYKKIVQRQNRIIEFENMIKNTFADKYLKLAHAHPAYKSFENNDKQPILVHDIIKADIMKIKELDDLIKNNIEKKYINYAFTHKIYYDYTFYKHTKVDYTFSMLEKEVNRKKNLDELIDSNIDKKYLNLAYSHYYYNNYLCDKKLKTEIAFNIIKNTIDKQINIDNREKELKLALTKKKIKIRESAATKAYFEYIQQDDYELNDAIINIIKEMDCLKRKEEIGKILTTKTSKFYINVIAHQAHKDYVNGTCSLELALKQIDEFITQMEIETQEKNQKQLQANRLNTLKSVIGSMDNFWRDEYLSLPISQQYINIGLPNFREVEKVYMKKRYELIFKHLQNEKWIKWKLAADKFIGLKSDRYIHLDAELFNFCDSEETEHQINSKNSIEIKYIHLRCEQLNLNHDTYTNNSSKMIIIEKPNDWIFKEFD